MCHSAYLHVPFCKDICSYCDFTRCRYHTQLAQRWLLRIQQEITDTLSGADLQTMYIGGGTPSALSLHQLDALLTSLQPYIQAVEEFTIEANIESFTLDKMQLCKAKGVNRISLGVQTLQPGLLKLIHRHHQRDHVETCLQQLHSCGFHNISIDLIYGLPYQTMEMWQQDLAYIIEHFAIQHISLYALSIEENSEFGRRGVENIDPDLEADMYEYALAYLPAHGFAQYEISSFAQLGKQSQHNLTYWHYEDFYGIGLGASGKRSPQRYDNTKNMMTYLEQGPAAVKFILSSQEERFERVMMGLRLHAGIHLQEYQQRFHKNLLEEYPQTIQTYLQAQYLTIEEGYLKTTRLGMLDLNDILVDMMLEQEQSLNK